MSTGRVIRVIDHSKRSGESPGKNGKPPYKWNIMTVEVEKDDGSIITADSFDTIVDGDTVQLEEKPYTSPTTGKTYTNWSASLPKAHRPGSQSASDSQAEILQAIRMVYRELKAIKADVKLLLGPPDDEPAAPPREEETAPVRDWSSVGQGSTVPETHVEPELEEPADLESFMNQ